MRGQDPARAGPGAWLVGAAEPALCLPQSDPGQPGTGDPGQAREDGRSEGMDLAASGGGVSSPRKLPGLLPVTLGRWESGEPRRHPAPRRRPGPTCANTPKAGRPRWAGGPDQVRGPCWAPDMQAAIRPSDLCVLGTS